MLACQAHEFTDQPSQEGDRLGQHIFKEWKGHIFKGNEDYQNLERYLGDPKHYLVKIFPLVCLDESNMNSHRDAK